MKCISSFLIPALCVIVLNACGNSIKTAQEFSPNKAPVVTGFTITDVNDKPIDRTGISTGMQIKLRVEAYDPEGDALTYDFDAGTTMSFSGLELKEGGCLVYCYTRDIIGKQSIVAKLTVRDTRKATAYTTLDFGTGKIGPTIGIGSMSPDVIEDSAKTSFSFYATSSGYYRVAEVADIPNETEAKKVTGTIFQYTASGDASKPNNVTVSVGGYSSTGVVDIKLSSGNGLKKVWVVLWDIQNQFDFKYAGVTIKPASADLLSLASSKGYIQPAFSSNVTDYLIAPVPNGLSSIQITPVKTSANAVVKIGTDVLTSGSPYTINSLSVGNNVRVITVTTPEGLVKNYTLNIYRAVPVFKTGQTQEYAVGDDGTYEKGVAWDDARFVPSTVGGSYNVITDTATGLMWRKDAFGATAGETCQTNARQTYYYSDWRAPNIAELETFFKYDANSTALNTRLTSLGFVISTTEPLCSNYTTPLSTPIAWHVVSNNGDNKTIISSTNNSFATLSVRNTGLIAYPAGSTGGLAKPITRYHIIGDTDNSKMVVDNMTGLVWLYNPYQIAGSDNASGSRPIWSAYITNINSFNADSLLNSTGNNDWRMPNIRELVTLLKVTTTVADSEKFPVTLRGQNHYSSTWRDVNNAYSIADNLMSTGVSMKSQKIYYVLPVRGPLE